MTKIALSPNEVQHIVSYCSEEVRRQQDGPAHVGYMVDAWMNALEHQYRGNELTLGMIEEWGRLCEPHDNAQGFRTVDVQVGGNAKARVQDIDDLMQRWIGFLPDMTADEAYREFEEIHPFRDANGRCGKIVRSYINGELLDPTWPPNFWGIENP